MNIIIIHTILQR